MWPIRSSPPSFVFTWSKASLCWISNYWLASSKPHWPLFLKGYWFQTNLLFPSPKRSTLPLSLKMICLFKSFCLIESHWVQELKLILTRPSTWNSKNNYSYIIFTILGLVILESKSLKRDLRPETEQKQARGSICFFLSSKVARAGSCNFLSSQILEWWCSKVDIYEWEEMRISDAIYHSDSGASSSSESQQKKQCFL